MYLMTFSDIKFTFPGSEPLFQGLCTNIHAHSRIGLIGRNGCGKSTLLKLAQGVLKPESGCISSNFARIGSLEQEHYCDSCLMDFLIPDTEQGDVLRKFLLFEQQAQSGDEYLEAVSLMCEFSGYDLQNRVEIQALQVGFSSEDMKRPFQTFSGGEQTRAALCRLMISEPDLLLLDEPTNHLDKEGLSWLSEFLLESRVPFVVVSHDRAFLDETVNTIWELDGTITEFSGDYSFFREQKDLFIRNQFHKHELQQKKIKKLNRNLEDRKKWAETYQVQTRRGGSQIYEQLDNDARRAMRKAMVVKRRIERMLEKEKALKPVLPKERKIRFPPGLKGNPVIVRTEALNRSFANHPLFGPDGLDMIIRNGEKIAITGKNGSGKTTLLRILAGKEQYNGSLSINPRAKCGYYSQIFTLDETRTVLQAVCDNPDQNEFARTVLGCLHISGDKVFSKIRELSPGEKSKVELARIICSGSNVLLLDEPTNHLEVMAMESLEQALAQFTGTVIFVTHDRMFVRNVAQRVINLDDFCSFL